MVGTRPLERLRLDPVPDRLEDGFKQRLCEAIERLDLIADARFSGGLRARA
jgi:hypothetical protein